MNADSKLREILRSEADRVEPSPAGWDRIKETVVVRRRRRTWLRGSMAAATALSVVAVFALVAAPDRDDRGVDNVEFATKAPTPERTQLSVVGDPDAAIAIWPLTTQAEVAGWQADPAQYPFLTDLDATATKFATEVLGIADPIIRSPEGDDVVCCTRQISRRVPGAAQEIAVTTLTMHDPTQGEPGYVVSAEADSLTLTAPTVGDDVGSPLVVTGTFAGTSQAIDVALRSAPAHGGRQIAKVRAEIGPDGWTATLDFAVAPRTPLSLFVTADSGADGGIADALATYLRYDAEGSAAATDAAAPSPAAVGDASYPSMFVGVQDGRIALFDTSSGNRVKYLTPKEPGGGASDPFVTDGGRSVVYVQGEGTCAGSVRKVTISGSGPKVLARPTGGRVPSSPEINVKGELAYVSTTCAEGAAGDSELVVGTKLIPVQSDDHATIDDISWSPDGDRIAVLSIFCCAQDHAVNVVDPDKHALVTDGQDLGGPNEPCRWSGLTYTLDSRLLVAEGCVGLDDGDPKGTRVRDLSDAGKRVVVEMSGDEWIESVSIDRTGDHLVLGVLSCAETCADAPSAAYRVSVEGPPRRVASNAVRPVWVY